MAISREATGRRERWRAQRINYRTDDKAWKEVITMAYNPEKTNAETSGNKPPATPKPVPEKLARGIGKTAVGGSDKK